MLQPVVFDHHRFVIDGHPRVLMCASLFPFRVPRAQWRQRLEAVKCLGYHAVDVYIPWNYHETAPGVWDFEGQHDIEAFLHMTHETGLYALVRPGPYICSEWDGGAIPAWIATDEMIDVRQNDPAFLKAVGEWYDKIMPIIARQQYRGAEAADGGPVIMVQVDNELDFFACRDPQGYIGALAEMMRAHGVNVPLISCAGQGDMLRACGGADGVAPAVNLYPGDNDVDVDEQVRYYRHASDAYDVPLVVTETNRWHRTLRRLVGNGARFIGPFLQVSGWDFDYGTSVNNWGRVEAYMTHDYDFGGVIDPAGQERPDCDDARRLCAIIDALGERLATAELADDRLSDVRVAASDGSDLAELGELDESATGVAVGALNLGGGGKLLTLTNVSEVTVPLRIGAHTAANQAAEASEVSDSILPDLMLPAGAGVMVPVDLPLGDGLVLHATSGELIALDESAHTLTLAAPTMVPGAIWAAFTAADDSTLAGKSLPVTHADADLQSCSGDGFLLVQGERGTATIGEGAAAWRVVFQQSERLVTPSCAPQTSLRAISAAANEPRWIPRCEVAAHDALPLEDWGVYSGTGRYRAKADLSDALGVVLHDAADTVSLRYGDMVSDWQACGGVDLWMPFNRPVTGDAGELTVTARIWGHSNFDDTRLDSLKLDAKRGIRGAMAIERKLDIGSGWLVGYGQADEAADGAAERELRKAGLVIGNNPTPRCGFGSRSTTVWPHTLTYTRTLSMGSASAACLHIKHGQTRCEVRVNGQPIGIITPLKPTLWLGNVADGSELAITVSRMWGEEAGRISLLLGHELTGWTCESQGLPELRMAGEHADYAPATMPLTVPGGKGVWLRVPEASIRQSEHAQNTVARFEGDGLQLTAFTNEHCLGRVVLGGLPGTVFAGGRGDLFLIPQGEGDLLLYVESTRSAGGVLHGVLLGGPIDR
ncbi:beta-galactosidase [Bifidobacterium oedipodis]|uniref:Beta-galactosidase n=1 Tax=Bifidobacterium oedipodis TaxID=2675322 RepID=A0A7Y0EQH3_9BIFI|nr:beta-galactosidase [Bifidobacterium sp. DSM 109957]NMM94589.1 beta-galactosidase [Bifidobacterium sp. DSM 109957]